MTDPQTPSQQPAPEGGGLLRFRLVLAYDGSDFAGWASQPDARTVQTELGSALQRVMRSTARITVAGRTDAGVHALGQVCHVDLPAEAWPGDEAAVRRLNAVLPADVRVLAADAAPVGFDARFSARSRAYEYLISDTGMLDPRSRSCVLVHHRRLDVPKMHMAGQVLLGEHDFAAFCKARPEASSVRTVLDLQVVRRADPRDPGLIAVDITADAFCHSMVRSVVGALVAVGEGRLDARRLSEVLAARRRVSLFATAPAHGLALVAVEYPPDDQLAEQATRARRYRG
jgi:tRNA pseudouridine38-40 synthase